MDKETKKEFEFLARAVASGFDEVHEKMATKEDLGQLKLDLLDAMDDKLADLKGDLVILMRKEDKKLINLINLLRKKTIITNKEAQEILIMEPFPKLVA